MKFGDRGKARFMWSKVAAGHTDAETEAWIRAVARKMLEADRASVKERPGAVLSASGLAGRDVQQRHTELFALRCYVEGVKAGTVTEHARDYMCRMFARDVNPEALDAWIRRLLQEVDDDVTRAEWRQHLKGRREI